MTISTLPRYSLGAVCPGQPAIPGVGLVINVPMDGIGLNNDPAWTEAAVIDRYIAECRAHGCQHVILDREKDQDLAILGRFTDAFYAAGIQPWWYGIHCINDSIIAYLLKEEDPARYAAWRDKLRWFKDHLPRRLNVCCGVYECSLDPTSQTYAAGSLELLASFRATFADARVLPVVWHRTDDASKQHTPIPPWQFRFMVRQSIEVFGRVMWWNSSPETESLWSYDSMSKSDPARVFASEAGVAWPTGAIP